MRIICCAVAFFLLGGCGVMVPAPGVEPGGVSRYSKIVVVPLLADEVRVVWNDGFKQLASARVATGWKTRDKATRIVAELLADSGATVRGVADVVGLMPEPVDRADWALEVAQRLRETGRVSEGDVVLLLRQNAIDVYGRQYSPVAEFLVLGPLGVALGAISREDVYQPSFVLALNIGFHAFMIGPSRCSIGFNAALVDAAATSSLAEANSIMGHETVPDSLSGRSWEDFSEAERRTAEAYCLAALRRALAEAANLLQLTTR